MLPLAVMHRGSSQNVVLKFVVISGVEEYFSAYLVNAEALLHV